MILRRFLGAVIRSHVLFGNHLLPRPFSYLFILQSRTVAYYVERTVESLLHNHLLAASLLKLVPSAFKGDRVVLPDGAFPLYAEISIQIDVAGKRYMDIGLIRGAHPEPFIIPGEILLKKLVGLLFCRYAP